MTKYSSFPWEGLNNYTFKICNQDGYLKDNVVIRSTLYRCMLPNKCKLYNDIYDITGGDVLDCSIVYEVGKELSL